MWKRYLRGLWLSGLRLSESLELSWDGDAPFTVDLSGRRPKFRIYAEGQKSHRDQLLPMTPDFAVMLLETPEDDRTGRVFRLDAIRTGKPITPTRVGMIVSKMGRKAHVVVDRVRKKVKEKVKDPETGKKKETGRLVEAEVIKYASAHDMRRAFGTRWAKRVKPATLQRLMRHEDIQTTMSYYVALDADELADELWAEFGNTFGNTGAEKGVKPASVRGR